MCTCRASSGAVGTPCLGSPTLWVCHHFLRSPPFFPFYFLFHPPFQHTHAGLPVADPAPGAPCFNGYDPQLPEGMCENAPPDTTSQQQADKKADKKKKGKGRKAGTPVGQVLSAVLLGLLFVLLLYSPKLYKWGRDRFEAWQIRRMVAANAARAQGKLPKGGQGKGRAPGAFTGKGRYAK